MAAVANIYRAASAVRQHLENSVLRGSDLTWTAFVVRRLVARMADPRVSGVAGLGEPALVEGLGHNVTGVARTLESRGLLRRADHPTDGRLVLLALTDQGEELMRRVFPEFNDEEAFVTAGLSDAECRSLAEGLRTVVLQVEEHGEERRRTLLNGAEPAPRRSGRRPKA